MADAAAACRSLGKNLMLIRKGVGEEDARADMDQCEAEAATRQKERSQMDQKNNRRIRDQQPARLIGVKGMFVQISHVEPSLTLA